MEHAAARPLNVHIFLFAAYLALELLVGIYKCMVLQ